MSNRDLNRRDFTRLTMAAMGGVVAGTAIGCGSKTEEKSGKTEAGKTEKTAKTAKTPGGGDDALAAFGDTHVCRGLNACKGKGKCAGEKNACAGTGNCATAEAHECGGQNKCKNQGGCDGKAAANECAGKGGCHVPLKPDAWKAVRAKFEAAFEKANGKKPGAAPAPAA